MISYWYNKNKVERSIFFETNLIQGFDSESNGGIFDSLAPFGES